MDRRPPTWASGAAWCAAAAFLSFGAWFAPARAAEGEGEIRLDVPPKERITADDTTQLFALKEGRSQEVPADLLTKAARHYIYRLTWVENHERKVTDGVSSSPDHQVMAYLLKQLYDTFAVPRSAGGKLDDNQLAYMQAYTKALVPAIDRVLRNPTPPIGKINAAMVLARLGSQHMEEAADEMVKVIEDKEQLDAVKLHALIGLRGLFQGEAGFANKKREARCIVALNDFVLRKPNYPQTATPPEVEAFRYLRREAVRALAASKWPVVLENDRLVMRNNQPAGRTALTLLRVMRKDGLTPEPSLSEQVEAAVGLCQLESKRYPDSRHYKSYQPDYALAQMGHFLFEFGTQAEQDRMRRNAQGNEGAVAVEAWQYQAGRLLQALETFYKDLTEQKYRFATDPFQAQRKAYVLAVYGRYGDLLRRVIDKTPPPVSAIQDLMQKTPPPDQTLFKDEKDTAVNPAKEEGQ